MQPNYYAVIPAHVRYDKTLPPAARLLYGEVTALANKEGYCFAGNAYFAGLYDVDKLTISRWLSKLKDKGYIDIVPNPATGERHIFLLPDPLTKKSTGVDEIINPPIQNNQPPYTEKSRGVDEKINHNTTVNTTPNTTVNTEGKPLVDSDESTSAKADTQEPKVHAAKGGYPLDFEAFWKDSEKPAASKKKAFEQWKRVPEAEQAMARQKLGDYKRYQPEARFRQDPERYLRNRTYENDFQSALRTSPVSGKAPIVATQFKAGSPD